MEFEGMLANTFYEAKIALIPQSKTPCRKLKTQIFKKKNQ